MLQPERHVALHLRGYLSLTLIVIETRDAHVDQSVVAFNTSDHLNAHFCASARVARAKSRSAISQSRPYFTPLSRPSRSQRLTRTGFLFSRLATSGRGRSLTSSTMELAPRRSQECASTEIALASLIQRRTHQAEERNPNARDLADGRRRKLVAESSDDWDRRRVV